MEEHREGSPLQPPLTRRQMREAAVTASAPESHPAQRAHSASPAPVAAPQPPAAAPSTQGLTRAQLRAMERSQIEATQPPVVPAPQMRQRTTPSTPDTSSALAELQALAAQTFVTPQPLAPSTPAKIPAITRAEVRTRSVSSAQEVPTSYEKMLAQSDEHLQEAQNLATTAPSTPSPAMSPAVPMAASVPSGDDDRNVADIVAEVNAVVARVEAALVAPDPHPSKPVLILGSGGTAASPADTATGAFPQAVSNAHSASTPHSMVTAPSAFSPTPAPSFLSVVSPQSARSANTPLRASSPDSACHQPVRSAVSPAIAQPHGHVHLDGLLAPSTSVGIDKRKTSRERSTRTGSGSQRWMSRFAVLGSIAAATIATPILMSGAAEDTAIFADSGPVEYGGPSTVDVVTAGAVSGAVPAGIAQSVTEDQRAYLVASRSEQREVLEGCDSGIRPNGTNGQLATSTLCRVMNNQYLRADAAVALAALNEQYQARFGHAMCLTDGYRTLSSQYTLKATKGSLAATPGTSNHGWGLAIDICADSYQAWDKWNWLNENGPTYGWAQPDWASRSYEPWHWEFTAGVTEMS
ncbi:M15 family metallopeptidase [Jonesia quinghaiensis]|uniref:M15 family metallopeptidase n=1 Tax=Jonesia quinghaiensis TaxID=262806 RepID=UPI0003FE3689|nr:M15 family metallopeptidase [Jonesia quinghaiensis]